GVLGLAALRAKRAARRAQLDTSAQWARHRDASDAEAHRVRRRRAVVVVHRAFEERTALDLPCGGRIALRVERDEAARTDDGTGAVERIPPNGLARDRDVEHVADRDRCGQIAIEIDDEAAIC